MAPVSPGWTVKDGRWESMACAGVGGLQAEADALEDEAEDGGHGGLSAGPGELPTGAPTGEERPAVGGVDDEGGLTSAVAALPAGDPEGGARRDLDARGRRVAGAHAELRALAEGGVGVADVVVAGVVVAEG